MIQIIKKAIYKYTNKINHKVYIGQTNNIKRRYDEHLRGHSYHTSLIERAIKKYGIENFDFEVLEWTNKPDIREDYWINYYRCYKPNGYNICSGGGYLPNQQGEAHSQCSISEEKARLIQKDLMNYDIPMKTIIKKYNINYGLLESIKNGHTWNYYGLTYPLRPNEVEINNLKAIKVIKMLKETKMSYKEIGKKVGWGASQIAMINQGTNHFQSNELYPIRKNPKDYGDKVLQCIKLLQTTHKTNREIAKELDVSESWVSRINVGKTRHQKNINYPIRKK